MGEFEIGREVERLSRDLLLLSERVMVLEAIDFGPRFGALELGMASIAADLAEAAADLAAVSANLEPEAEAEAEAEAEVEDEAPIAEPEVVPEPEAEPEVVPVRTIPLLHRRIGA